MPARSDFTRLFVQADRRGAAFKVWQNRDSSHIEASGEAIWPRVGRVRRID